jgi:hypothetical protein
MFLFVIYVGALTLYILPVVAETAFPVLAFLNSAFNAKLSARVRGI